MERGALSRLSKAIDIKLPTLFTYFKKNGVSASPANADRLAELTGTDIRLWLNGGSVDVRRAVVDTWYKNQIKPEKREALKDWVRKQDTEDRAAILEALNED